MYFLIKDEKVFGKYMEIWENISNIIKTSNSELICNKRYLKILKKYSPKEKAYNIFYTSNIDWFSL